MVLELVSGGDLWSLLHPNRSGGASEFIERHRFPWKLRLRIAIDVACGMKAMQSHTPPIIHWYDRMCFACQRYADAEQGPAEPQYICTSEFP